MVLVTGAVVGTVATCPPLVSLFGQAGATAAGTAVIPTVAVSEGIGIGGSVLAVGEGAVVGAGVIGSGGSSAAGIALSTFVGPIGWAVVGCNKNGDHNGDKLYTWDCWKPVVRDVSTQPSHGMTLHRLATHPNVRSMSYDQGGLLVGNVFGEHFRLTPISIKGTLAFHASVSSP